MLSREAKLREILESRFKRMKRSNTAYSLRAFARDLNTTPATLSRILGNKSNLSQKTILNLMNALDLSGDERSKILDTEMFTFTEVPDNEDYQHFIDNWQDAAIAALVETKGFRFDEQWIAHRLSISMIQVRESLGRLFRLGILIKSTQGRVSVQDVALTSSTLARPQNKPDKNLLAKTQRLSSVLRENAVEMKSLSDITSITMAIDPSRLPEAKKRIQRFRRSLAKYLDRGDKREVYVLMFGVFPVSKS